MDNQQLRRLPPLGLQPIIFGGRYDFGKPDQLDEFMKAVSSIGFSNVEAFPTDPKLFKEVADRYGIGHSAIHLSLSRTTETETAIRCLEVTGARDVCNSGLMKWGDLTARDYYDALDILNRMGREFAREGIRFHYHNHDFEFKKVDGEKTGMDILMEGLDFSVIDLAVDVAWVYRGGHQPADYLRRHQDKISYLHLKDTDGTNWRELGRGVLDFDSIIAAIEEMPNVHWAIVEQDNTDGDPIESSRISREFLKARFGY